MWLAKRYLRLRSFAVFVFFFFLILTIKAGRNGNKFKSNFMHALGKHLQSARTRRIIFTYLSLNISKCTSSKIKRAGRFGR